MFVVTTLLMLAAFDGSATETQQAEAQKPAEKIICRTYGETGSLVKHRKVCHTASQWKAKLTEERDGARRMLEDNAGKPALSN